MSRKIVIIGGVAGGASCAARLRRLDEHAEICLVERGPYISFANCGLPYHLSKVIPDRNDLLVQTAERFARRFNVQVLVDTEAVAFDPAAHKVTLRRLCSAETEDHSYDVLVLSPGAEPIRPPLPGVDLDGVHVLRNIPDLDRIVAHLERTQAKQAVVVGGGFIGIEVAENLALRGLKVSVVEMANQVMPLFDPEMAAPIAWQLALHGLDVRLGAKLQGIRSTEETTKLTVDLATGETLPADLVILAIGVRPEVTLAKQAGLALGPQGGIQVDRSMRTSNPDVFAVGDAVEICDRISGCITRMPLAGPANRQGRLVADIIAGREVDYPGALGTSILKAFELTAASTGLTEKQANRLGIAHRVVWTHGGSHAGYYPGATTLSFKLLFAPDTGRILGAQVVGQEGVDKRIDVLATALAMNASVFDLEALDLAYAPPFSSAKDPVNHLAATAANVLRGDHPICRWDELNEKKAVGSVLLDVRTADEHACGTIPGARNIPVDDLRARLSELPKDKPIVVFCQVGLRGYLATRLLMQFGFDAANLSGGYKLWQMANTARQAPNVSERPFSDSIIRNNSACASEACAPSPAQVACLVPTRSLDLRGLQCPGPILKVKEAMEPLAQGEVLAVRASDPGFALDLPAWAKRTNHEVLSITSEGRDVAAILRKSPSSPQGSATDVAPRGSNDGQTIVVFSGDLDKAMAAMIIATGAVAMGRKPTLFFTFWGLSLLRRPVPVPVRKGFKDRLFGAMLPRGAARTRLSKMHMGGAGTAMMRRVMRSKNIDSLPDMLERAQKAGVRMVACQMSMDVMGIHQQELIDGIEVGGVAAYLGEAEKSNINLFI